MLVFEDVHWADQAPLDVLRVLGRRVDTTRALVVATYRDDEVDRDHPLRIVLGELASAAGVKRLSVPRLSLEAVREFAEPYGADAEAIHGLTHGNAFYVTEILAAGGDELPETVRDAVLARAALLEPPARRLLEASRSYRRASSSGCSRSWRPSSSGSTRVSSRASSGPTATASRSVTSWRDSPSRPRSRRHRRRALHRSDRVRSRGGGDVSRLAHHAEEAGDSAAVLRTRRLRRAGGGRASTPGGGGAVRACAQMRGRSGARGARAVCSTAYAEEAHATGKYEESVDARLEALAFYRELGDRLGWASVCRG